MSQETNLNVSPYFDDFDVNKDYYKVLFKPEYPIQARELTTLQSILQNQIETYGSHIFKEGSVVIPGQLSYEKSFPSVEIDDTYNGISISLYFDQLIGKKLKGSVSGVTAEVVYLLNNFDSDRGNYTLYLKYLQSGGVDYLNKTFISGETLLLETTLTYGSITIPVGQGICNTILTNATSKGTAVSIASGVYFVRGFFAKVNNQTILLDQYSTTPSYKIGFDILEDIITSDDDETLFDNAKGFSNYAAPGADRFKITLELSKRTINDRSTNNFVEIFRVENGIPKFFNKNPQYNIIRDELAKRTFDESGNYFVRPFAVIPKESLNDRISSNGIYFANQRTIQGNTPSDDLLVYQIGPGKAYVNGYDVETISSTLIDITKPRTTETTENQSINYNAGSLCIVNNCYGSPSIGFNTNSVVNLMDSRIGSNSLVSSGSTIGYARVYDFVPESSYIDDTSRLKLRLYDIQTFTKIGLTTSFENGLTTPCLIEGKKSRATGYLKNSVTSSDTELILYETTGNFLSNEQIVVNGIDNGRLIKSVTDYSISDVKSLYSKVGINTFNADLVLDKKSYIANPGTVFKVQSGIVTSGLNITFTNKVKVGDIVTYPNTTFTGDPIYNKITNISSDGLSFTISGITTVTGICNGILPSGDFEVSNIIKVSPSLDSSNSSFLTPLIFKNVESVNLQNNELSQRRLYNVSSYTGGSLTINIDPSDVDIYFDSFDEDKYVITYSDGTIEQLRSDKFNMSLDGKSITFNGLKSSDTNIKVITTVKNINPSYKNKKLNKATTLIVSGSNVSNSGIGTTTLNDGLTYTKSYGTRVQDNQICLNVPDVVKVLGVFESATTSDPFLPVLQLVGINQNYVVGETFEGRISGAVGIVISKKDNDKIEYVSLNQNKFIENEIIFGYSSNTESTILNVVSGSKNITDNFILDDGQRSTFYDYSRLIRKGNVQPPTKKIKIVFQNYTINSNDTGEFIVANSYFESGSRKNVPFYDNFSLTDYIDIRPRVAPYTDTSLSPFEFSSRIFDSDGQYSKYILSPEENILLSYSYYLGRIDIITLNSNGTFEILFGNPSLNPTPPVLKSNSLDIATITLPPYLFNVEDIKVNMSKHKRYQMSDISLLESRINNIEEFTTLSLLESKTENFVIKDAQTGLDRFKSGFFVDNFSSSTYQDIQNPSFRSLIDVDNNTLRPLQFNTSLELQLGSEAIQEFTTTYNSNIDQSYVTNLGNNNIVKTGDLITLNYQEVLYDQQPFATKTESVTPFLVKYWEGIVTLNPSNDTWIESTQNNVTSSTVQNVRSRNIEFDAHNLKPVTRYYNFFEGVDVNSYVVPKLLEIEMISNTFEIGETIETNPFSVNNNSPKIRFRLCKPNHKTGLHDGSDNSTDVYDLNPYTQQTMPTVYTENSTILNVDTRSLELQTETSFYGMVSVGMELVGKNSGAVAKVKNLRLVSDNSGRLIGSLYIPNPNVTGNPRWSNGTNSFLLIDTSFIPNSNTQSTSESSALNLYTSSGIFQTTPPPTSTTTQTSTSTQNISNNIWQPKTFSKWSFFNFNSEFGNEDDDEEEDGSDPLAQSFYITQEYKLGVFLTSIEVFFETKDEKLPVILQIRPIIAGVPSVEVIPYSKVVLYPKDINVSTNSNIPTKFTFPSPVYLPGPQQLSLSDSSNKTKVSEYAIVLLSNSAKYKVFVSELGNNDIITGERLSKQYTLGSMFKSQNGSTWTPSQFEDLKCRIYRANFTNNGLVRFFNPNFDLGNNKVNVTTSNDFLPLSKKIIVGLGSTGYDVNNVVPGVTLVQNSATGKLVGIAGSIKTGTGLGVSITNTGFGYTSGTFTNVVLKTETGDGNGAVATIGVTNVGIATVTITNGGYGYRIGDSLLIPETGMGQNVGFGGRLTVTNIGSNDTFIIDNVQGSFQIGITTLRYINSSGVSVITGNNVNIKSIQEDPYYDGLHMKIIHKNHSMHSQENYVNISNFLPLESEVNTQLISELSSTETSLITISSSSGFELFEGEAVSSNNPGYVLIGNEIISYTNYTTNTLTIGTRGIDNSQVQTYASGTTIQKYEFNGISLRRINKDHNFAEVNFNSHPIELDSYFIKIDTSDKDFNNIGIGSNRINNLYFKETIQSGSPGAILSNNIQFESITPNISYFIPSQTNISARMRTFSGTSIGGNEKSFIDNGFTNVSIENTTFFNNPQLICSPVNEEKLISGTPGSKSFTMEFLFTSNDGAISPVIDYSKVNLFLTSNLINSPNGVNENSNYEDDDNVRSLFNDKHSSIYISKPINLKIPANSIKVLLSASRDITNDIRVLYQLYRDDSTKSSQNFELFPGYSNYRIDGQGLRQVIDSSLNDGSEDVFTEKDSDRSFKDYEYTVDNLPDFNAFAIKIIMAGTNQAVPPLIKQLRAIATIKPKV